ncbi:peptide chain release factor 2 [Anaerorhabdus furcosa]|uniref:peptide chain release factor 2 n=1 Tax=Anaerorhabdus furcosa TaxID=118967 RepID=UPI001178C13A|nr:peptide chain release factor 2 [Anaerorhabdus furcosa]
MELYEIKQSLETSSTKLIQLGDSLDLANKKEIVAKNEEKMAEEGFWNDPKAAQVVIQETNGIKELISLYSSLKAQLLSIDESVEEMKKTYDEELMMVIEEEYVDTMKQFEDFEIKVLLSHPYDKNNAILELHPGAGGTESQDWAQMLFRMYSRWAEDKGYKVTVLDYQDGDEAGMKSCSILIEGYMVYGYLKAEKGVHRLVRISPFDSSGRRHTSFASVDVMPQFNNEIEITIDEKDLDITTMRASGAGGQHVNKTDSAVRMVHKPTGITVTCQTERSQIQNREHCLNMLKSKLYQRMIEEQEARVNAMKGDHKAIEWGSQIRSYVFCPYTLVKDHRTGVEIGNVSSVMDGNIDEFIFGYLKSQI